MKRLLSMVGVLVFGLGLTVKTQAQEVQTDLVPVETATAAATTCAATTWVLTAGQTIPVGTVSVTNDATNVYVTYTLTYPDATFGNLHLWIGNSLTNLPSNSQGVPVPGQFCSAAGGACADASGLTTYQFTVPFPSSSIVDGQPACGSALYVVTHAEVTIKNSDGTTSNETAFGGDQSGGTEKRWWFYGAYAICCDFGGPGDCEYETAFAKGGWVFTTDKKSNPEKLPSLNLTNNRWGWAINLTMIGTKTYDIWAGAGLNKTINGTKVGTLTVAWDGAAATVTYNLTGAWVLDEVHIYASDFKPTTTAPGQYGYPTEGYEQSSVTTFSYTVPVADTNGDGVWLIAHAVVSTGVCTH